MDHTAIIDVRPPSQKTVLQEIGEITRPIRILVVDDNADALTAVSRLLATAGYEIVEALTGEEALRLARARRPDLILLDVNLPDISGIEVCKQIKADPDLTHVFVVHVSAVETSSENQVSGLDAGADGYIVMPVKYAELLARVQAMVRIMRAEEAVRFSEKLWRTVFTASNDILLLLDDAHSIRACNAKAAQAYGYGEEELVGMSVRDLCAPQARDAIARRLAEAVERNGRLFEAEQVRKNGAAFAAELSGCSFAVGERRRFILSVRDITARKEAEAKLRYFVSHDILTNLYNRVFFIAEMDRVEGGGPFPVSIAVADVAGLRATNEGLGHAAGDELIARTAMVLRNALGSQDVIARLGGDEFAALLPGAGAAAAAKAVERIRNCLDDNNRNYPDGPGLSLSIGTATAHTGDMLVKALKKAEERLYEDKLALPGRAHL